MRVLIVEDNDQIGRSLVKGFQEHGFQTHWAHRGEAAVVAAFKSPPDVIVLDRMLPDGEGLTFLETIRRQRVTAPAIVLSALTSLEDRVAGLDGGADDYLAKPFAFAELLARVRALLRRGLESAVAFEVGDLTLELHTREVTRGGRRIELTSVQFALLALLMKHAGEVVSRKMILEHVWEPGVESATNAVDVYISRLRNKIDKGEKQALIHTVRGLGYVLRPE
jgi:DNA-binding response OmpR family regulator